MSSSSITTRHRRSTTACDECRRRKVRCDGEQPRCGVCLETGVDCEITQRATRGPKKGHLRDLKNRLVHLEAVLGSRAPGNDDRSDFLRGSLPSSAGTPSRAGFTPSVSPTVVPDPCARDTGTAESCLPCAVVACSSDLETFTPSVTSDVPSTRVRTSLQPITQVMHDELLLIQTRDQLYVDRVHPSIPILHQRRYMAWSKSSTMTPSRKCLQYAMWTLAALLSAQLRDMIDPLYQETKQMLERQTVDGEESSSNVSIELAQAWVLVATFESMRTYHRRAWMSVGRAFRLVQAMHYHEIDSPIDRRVMSSQQQGDFIQVEEKRRVFWMAYFLDHIISLRDDWPITLNEHVICTRLPIPDPDFQNGVQELGPLLSEALTDPALNLRSPFNECLILTTICGRSLLRSQQYQISKAYGSIGLDCTEQQRWLDGLLSSRLKALSHCYPSPLESNDPLILFTNILAQAAVIYYCKSMAETAPPSSIQATFEQKALEACRHIISLAETLPKLPSSKLHPLMPMPLFLCAEFLYGRMESDGSARTLIQRLFGIFCELRTVSDPEKSYVDLLPRSCVSKTADMICLC
ncbi:fungal-specific transcription factor domain-containing protein [Aspergillus germanicus]